MRLEVRVNALLCLGDLVYTLSKHAVLDILQTVQRCTAVDRSAPTLMCTLAIANSILKQLGVEFTAEHVLPLVTPLLTAQQLNVQQFAKYMLFVKNILKEIEENRGVSVTDSGIPEVKASAPANGLPLQASNTANETVASTTKRSPAWDEDWDLPAKQASASFQNSTNNITTSSPVLRNLPIQTTTHMQSLLIPEASNKQKTESCPSVDIEWPPRASFGITTQSGDIEKHLKTGISSTASFDDIDPFANWPPKPSGSASVVNLNKGIAGLQSNKYESKPIWNASNNMNLQKNNSNSWTFDIQSSNEHIKQHQGNSTSTTSSLGIGGLNPQNSIGILKQSQGITASSTDIGAIYASSKNEQTAPRLAPPPSTPVGRRRVRGSPSSSHPVQVKSSSGQPPLLDLL